jgi:outer membrane lipoprotein LolB
VSFGAPRAPRRASCPVFNALLLALAVLALAGCGTMPAPPAGPGVPPGSSSEAARWSGRLALNVAASPGREAVRLAAAFELHGNADVGRFELYSPLGQVLARAAWQPGAARLDTADGQSSAHASLPALAQAALGEPLPLQALFDWLRGQPWAGAASSSLAGGFRQLGWAVNTGALAEGRLTAQRDAAPPSTAEASLRVLLERP